MSLPPLSQWTSASGDAHFSPPKDCARRVTKFERQIRIRNWIEYGAGVFVLVLFGTSGTAALFKGDTMIGLSLLSIVLGTMVVMRELRRRGSNLDRQPEDDCVTHLRRQYERQYDALRKVPIWYVGPFMPGLALFYVSIAAGYAETVGWKDALIGVAGPVSYSLAFAVVVLLLNWWVARALKAKIDNLDALVSTEALA
ncbi:MAG: hypothetical protein AAF697_00750 [Pseudomonadota bacterium]